MARLFVKDPDCDICGVSLVGAECWMLRKVRVALSTSGERGRVHYYQRGTKNSHRIRMADGDKNLYCKGCFEAHLF